MKSHLFLQVTALAAGMVLAVPGVAHAQLLPYADVSGSVGGSGDDAAADGESGDDAVSDVGGYSPRSKKFHVTPYIEAQQVVTAELSPGSETLTYSTLAVGADANLSGRNYDAGMAMRYERRFGWGSNKVPDSDVISGMARASVGIVPKAVFIEGGAMAARMSAENNGSTVAGQEFGDSATQVYAAYIGPSVKTRAGDVEIEGHYRFGYNKVTSPNAVAVAPGQNPVDVYDEGKVHAAQLHVGTRPGEPLPIGIGVGAGWMREDVNNLDQRVDDKNVRGDVILPIGGDLALVGGVGYEKVEVSHRDAVKDTVTGLPVLDASGRYVTDKSQARQLAYESEGLIWDAGVMWRPSKRTALEAHVGRRYGSTTYFGSFAYAPSARSSLNISVYDSVTGFGGMLNKSLASMPTNFEGLHNPLTGGLSTCVAAVSQAGSNSGTCLNGALASVRSSVFRGRGAIASFNVAGNTLQYGIGAGYDRRRFISVPGTVLASANLLIDENYWVAAYLNGRIDRNSSFGTNIWANWYQSGDALAGDTSSLGASAAYYRTIARNLSATLAVGVNGVNRDQLEDIWSASALAGVRYSF
ncbi:preprotein translocase subunit YajC [Novosphingobium sp.]|uniref:preprotein translocase subunit YajC n=1 Tax=Novosphingobium sp. TaxID=1874826 RepID=UPI0025DBDE42|nr:preprotein translocase subunit YajC [Novosphingobium sp.]MCC6924266.1 preprotein translocase subunit YajC [Novosphingobium sp.]